MDRSLQRPLSTTVFLIWVTLVASLESNKIDHRPHVAVTKQSRPVTVTCHPDSLEVVVQADLFGTGLLVEGRHLRLGLSSAQDASACGAVASGPTRFSINVPLTQCDTKLSSTQEKIIYSNVLIYSPEPKDGLFRLDATTIPVECHYNKNYAVNPAPLLPSWVPLVSEISAQDQIDFNLRLLTDDGLFVRGSNSYFLGEPIHMEVSNIMGHHVPLKVFVDHCVATSTPDADSELRYDFVTNHGCLVDAHLTNSNSRYFPRVENHSLRFSLDAFRFHQEPDNQIYITCYLKAVPLASQVDSENRACSFNGKSWESVDGDDQACASCEFRGQTETPTATLRPETTATFTSEPASAQQPAYVQSNTKRNPASFHRIRPGTHLLSPRQSAWFTKREAEHAVRLGPLTVMPYPNSTL